MSAHSAPFRGVRRQSIPTDSRAWIAPVAPARFPLAVGSAVDVDLAGWAAEHGDVVATWLAECGAILFRGFGVGLAEFGAVARALAGTLIEYRERSTPRTELEPGVYTSTEHPADQHIGLHNENSYQDTFPARLVLCCLVAAQHGGETPLADTRRVLARIDSAVLARFRRRGVRYVRNYSSGVGLTWQEAFQETDRARVEHYCRDHGITATWRADDTLRTEAVRPAVAVHPGTGDLVWFNHAAFFHISALEPALREALLVQFGEDGLPVNTYYGDGEPIERDVITHVRAAYAAETVVEPWRQGDVMLVDNLLVAHGRAAYRGPRRVVVSLAGRLTHDALAQPVAP